MSGLPSLENDAADPALHDTERGKGRDDDVVAPSTLTKILLFPTALRFTSFQQDIIALTRSIKGPSKPRKYSRAFMLWVKLWMADLSLCNCDGAVTGQNLVR